MYKNAQCIAYQIPMTHGDFSGAHVVMINICTLCGLCIWGSFTLEIDF